MQVESFSSVINAIFDKLAVRYGAAWLRQWEGVDMNLVKTDWGMELNGFSSNLEPLRYALRHLPERCPNVSQFRALANSCPLPAFKQLPAPKADAAKVAEQIAKQTGLKQAMASRGIDPKEWAHRIMSEVQGGHAVSRYRRESAEVALGMRTKLS